MNEEDELSECLARVRQGDQAAFEVIFRRYRSAAFSWSFAIVRDPYQADDVVQESFLRMKEKIHQLEDDRKFAAWFRLMVRRMSYNTLRSAPRNRELDIHDVPESKWLGLAKQGGGDLWHEGKESERMVRHALGKITRQAREILKASVYEEATPEEMAQRFNMKKSNVYNVLSRAKSRANEERLQAEVDALIQERSSRGNPMNRLLLKPASPSPYNFLSVMIGEALRCSGESGFSYTELMGISGEAFRLNMPENCDWRKILAFDWSFLSYRTMERLGFNGVCVGRPRQLTITPDLQTQILSVILGSIDRGIPAVIYNVEINEMGFAYGYDNHAQQIRYLGNHGWERVYRYSQIGRTSQAQPLFVLGLRRRTSPPLSTDQSLRAIVDHARGKEPPLAGTAFGLAGYLHWLGAAEENKLDVRGHAYLVAILAEARTQAARYITLLSEKKRKESDKRRLLAAAECYRQVSECFRMIYPKFPFGYGGSPASQMKMITEQLRKAYAAEREGIDWIESCVFD